MRLNALNAFPPQDIGAFLHLNAGHWLTLRSLMGPDSPDLEMDSALPADGDQERGQSWHQADRGELRVAFFEATRDEDCGELEIAVPDGSSVRLIFQRDGTLLIGTVPGRWHLGADGSLEMAIREETRIVNERIWFSKPNLRLRCALEQFLDGRPSRASFSSEIRRLGPSKDAS